MRIGILTAEEFGQAYHPEDILLRTALASAGVEAEIFPWQASRTDYSAFDAVMIRTCWDYDEAVDAFTARLAEIAARTRLFNPLEIVMKNRDKHYLAELAARGIPVIETVFADGPEMPALPQAEILIIKPTVSAEGRDTYRVATSDTDAVAAAMEKIRTKGKTPMIQPYIASVETFGERSSVVIDGQNTFTMKKTPASGGFLVHNHRGGTYTPKVASTAEEAFVRTVTDLLPELPLYMRIDYLMTDEGFQVLELEQIEPNLYLRQNPEGLRLLIAGLLRRIGQ